MRRLPRRLLRHHLPIGVAVLACGALLFRSAPSPDLIERLSFASAYPALVLIAATLLVGPLKLIGRKRLPVTIDLRRDTGIWAGMTGIFHAGVGQFVHLRGRPWLYYIYDHWQAEHFQPVRYDLFGLANFSGLIAVLILLALFATSNDFSLRKLGSPGWKKLQRWNYAVFALTAVHTFLYQEGIEHQPWPLLGTAIVTVSVALVAQYRGYRMRKNAAQLSAEIA